MRRYLSNVALTTGALAVMSAATGFLHSSSVQAQSAQRIDFATLDVRRTSLGASIFAAAEDSDEMPDAMFQSILTAFRLRDGRLVVADAATRRLALYDQEGSVISSWGRTGAGPGERRSLTWAMPWGRDSVMVYDRSLRRLTLYYEGEMDNLWSLDAFGPFETPTDAVGLLANGTILLRRSIELPTEAGSTRSRDVLLAADLGSRRVRDLVQFDGDELFTRRSSSGGLILGTPPIRRSTIIATGRTAVAVGDSDSGLVRVVRVADGSEVRLFLDDGDRRLTEAGIAARLDEILRERPTAVSPQWERLQREMISAKRFPAFGELRLDDLDRLWVQRWDRSRRGRQSWLVIDFNRDERHLIELPRYCRPTQITASSLTCVNSNPDELQSAATYRLPSASP